MKKLLVIVVLGLLLSGNAYSKSEIDAAIEKCADTQIVLGNEKNIPKSFYEDHEVYKVMLKDKEQLQKDYDEYGDFYSATYKKYWKDNPRPKYPKQSTMSTYNFEDYKKAKAEWEREEEKYLKPFTAKVLAYGKSIKKQDALIAEMIRSLTAMKLKTLGLKDKAKNIQEYTEKFILCESTHSKTPKGFMLQWGD
ncbi:hypothetical protein N9M42_03265 [Candidatus Pelagibacter bacterium]|jgi:hypothetical protein|nr:hypothetical protein [Candidatus Pelagibacter bacterium]